MNSRYQGMIQIVLSGACFGLLGLFGKMAYERGLSPGEFLSLRFISSSFLMALFFVATDFKKFKISVLSLRSSLLLGVMGYAVFSSCYFLALKGLSASLTVLLLYTYPIFVTLVSHFILKERVSAKGWLALCVSFIGLVALVWGEWTVYEPVYLFYGFGSAIFYAIYVMTSGKLLKGVHPLSSSFYIQLSAGVTLFIINFNNYERPLNILESHYVLMFAVAFICSFLAMTLFLYGIQKITSSEASILSTSEPFFGVVTAIIFLNEKMSVLQFFGACLIISGMSLTAFRRKA